jgi:hypothetical protein
MARGTKGTKKGANRAKRANGAKRAKPNKNIVVPDIEGNEVSLMKLIRNYIYIIGTSFEQKDFSHAELFQLMMQNLESVRVKSGFNMIIEGDVIDKHWSSNHENFAMNDLYVFFASLKRNNTNNVFLISGNRDSNKTRVVPLMSKFSAEAQANGSAEFGITQAFIDSLNGRADAGLRNGLTEMATKGEQITAIKFIRLILGKTMGIIPADFLLHVAKQVFRETGEAPTDEQIVERFIANFSASSAWHEYMVQARICHVIGSNLFSHCVPVPYKTDGTQCFDLAELFHDLDTFYTSRVGQIGSLGAADWSAWDSYWLPNEKSWATTQLTNVNFTSPEYQALLAAFQTAGIKNLVSCHLPVGATPVTQCLGNNVTLFRLDMYTQPTAAVNVDTNATTTENICHFKFSSNGDWTCSGKAFGRNYRSSNRNAKLVHYGKTIVIDGEKWDVRNITGGFVHLHYFLFTPPSTFVTKYKCLEATAELLEYIKSV